MGIVFSHAIAASFYYIRNGRSLNDRKESRSLLMFEETRPDVADKEAEVPECCLCTADTTSSFTVSKVGFFFYLCVEV